MARFERRKTRYSGVYAYDNAAGETRYSIRFRNARNRSTERTGFTTQAAARAALAANTSKVNDGTFVQASDSRTRLAELWPAFHATKSGLRARSRANVESAWQTHVLPRWGHHQIGNITRDAAQQWVAELVASGLSASQVINVTAVLRGMLDMAVTDRLVNDNPTRGLKLPRKHRKATRRYLTFDEVSNIAEQLSPLHLAIFTVLVFTGIRWGELAALKVGNVDLGRRRLSIEQTVVLYKGEWLWAPTKSYARRTVPLPHHVIAILRNFVAGRRNEELLFRSDDGMPVRAPRPLGKHKTRLESAWLNIACKKVGVAYLSPHELRHTAASLAISEGASPLVVQRMLGHKSANETLHVYADLFDHDLDDVADRLGRAWEKRQDMAPALRVAG